MSVLVGSCALNERSATLLVIVRQENRKRLPRDPLSANLHLSSEAVNRCEFFRQLRILIRLTDIHVKAPSEFDIGLAASGTCALEFFARSIATQGSDMDGNYTIKGGPGQNPR